MQYMAALLWLWFLNLVLRDAYREHCVRGGLQEKLRRLSMIRTGMSKQQVHDILGSPAKVLGRRDRLSWQYVVGNEYKMIEFVNGHVVTFDLPVDTEVQAA